jgi:tetratricopeptide (TPR) repeat protein
MSEPDDLPEWKEELDAIVGARAHGQSEEIFPRLQKLDRSHPNIAEINYQLGWTCDVLGREKEALPYYEKAVALGLPPNELSGALIGLGATLRELGQLDRSAEVLSSGKAQFPENREFDVFLALTRHAQGRHPEAMKLLIDTLCETTEDVGLNAYQRAFRHAASKLERSS